MRELNVLHICATYMHIHANTCHTSVPPLYTHIHASHAHRGEKGALLGPFQQANPGPGPGEGWSPSKADGRQIGGGWSHSGPWKRF